MNEVQRMQYLSALDVDCYMPRFSLPNASALVQCELPVAVLAVSNSTAVDQQATVDLPSSAVCAPASRQSASDVLASLGVGKASSEIPVKDSLTTGPEKAAAVIEKAEITKDSNSSESSAALVDSFSLSLYQVADLLVLDSRNLESFLPTDRLLANMMLALGYRPEDITAPEILSWPFDGMALSNRTESDARIDLQAFLDGRLLNSNLKTLVLLGESAARYILPESNSFDSALYKTVTMTDLSVDAVVLPSLSELLQDASLKSAVWAALQNYKCESHV